MTTDKKQRLDDAVRTLYTIIRDDYLNDLPSLDNYQSLEVRPEVVVTHTPNSLPTVRIEVMLLPELLEGNML